jgi:hypothetical protein
MSKSVKLRLEEYVPAASFLQASFARDRAELEQPLANLPRPMKPNSNRSWQLSGR